MADSRAWLRYLENGEAFAAENFHLGVGGLLGHIQLFNPVASGKRIRLRMVEDKLGSVVGHNVRLHSTPLTTLGVPATFVVQNLHGSGPAAVAEMRSEAPVAALGTLLWQISANANTPAQYPAGGTEWGADLLEGEGVLVQAAAGAVIIANWMWVEVPL